MIFTKEKHKIRWLATTKEKLTSAFAEMQKCQKYVIENDK